MESRPSHNKEEPQFEIILKLDIARDNLVSLLKLMKQSTALNRVTVTSATNFVGDIPGNVHLSPLFGQRESNEIETNFCVISI